MQFRHGMLAALLGVAAMTFAAPTVQAQTTLKFSHTDTPVGSRQKAAEFFAQKVAEYTKNKYKVEIFHSGQIANDPKAVEQLALGGIDFTVTGTGTYATHVKALNLTALPFLVDSYAQGWKFYDESPWLKAQFEQLPTKGMRVLAVWEAGFRSFTTKEPLTSPADAKGKKMRVFPNDMIRWIMESIGFSPVVLPVTEVYLAIQQGTVAGQENPTDTIYSLRFYEVAPHITLTRHVYSPLPLSVSEITWQRLSAEEREAITKAAKEAGALSRKLVQEDEQKQLDEMTAKGAKIAKPNIGPFRESVKSVYDKAREVYGKEVDDVLATADQIRKSTPSN
jgi:tripartite ATP-independent transporter DctP family solute receptor